MKNTNKIGYALMIMVSQASFAVSDDYLKKMGEFEAEWNEYAPASKKVLELDASVELISHVAESFATERFNASNRSKKIQHLQTILASQENRIIYVKSNAKDSKFNLCEVALNTEETRLELVKLYAEEIDYLSDLDARFSNQGKFGLMNEGKTKTWVSYLERSDRMKEAIDVLKEVAARKNDEYQLNTALDCKEKLAGIAKQISELNRK